MQPRGKRVLAFLASPFCFLSNVNLDTCQLKLRASHRKHKTQQRVFLKAVTQIHKPNRHCHRSEQQFPIQSRAEVHASVAALTGHSCPISPVQVKQPNVQIPHASKTRGNKNNLNLSLLCSPYLCTKFYKQTGHFYFWPLCKPLTTENSISKHEWGGENVKWINQRLGSLYFSWQETRKKIIDVKASVPSLA